MHFVSRLCFVIITALAIANAAYAEASLRVVSYNIHAGRGMDGKIDLPRIAAVLKRLNPDVVLLQEVDMGTKRSGEVSQAVELGKLMGMHFYFAKAMNYGGGEYGNAILSKLPFANTSTLPLIGGAEDRCAGIVEIMLPQAGAKARDAKAGAGDLRVMLVDVHLDARKRDVHVEHVRKISAEVARLTAERPAAVIWGGDFNARETSPIWDVLKKEYGWTQPEKQGARATSPSVNPKSEIDWFLYKAGEAKAPALTISEYKVVGEPMASDHCPVVFAVRLGGGK